MWVCTSKPISYSQNKFTLFVQSRQAAPLWPSLKKQFPSFACAFPWRFLFPASPELDLSQTERALTVPTLPHAQTKSDALKLLLWLFPGVQHKPSCFPPEQGGKTQQHKPSCFPLAWQDSEQAPDTQRRDRTVTWPGAGWVHPGAQLTAITIKIKTFTGKATCECAEPVPSPGDCYFNTCLLVRGCFINRKDHTQPEVN